jgi:hypothetical protein
VVQSVLEALPIVVSVCKHTDLQIPPMRPRQRALEQHHHHQSSHDNYDSSQEPHTSQANRVNRNNTTTPQHKYGLTRDKRDAAVTTTRRAETEREAKQCERAVKRWRASSLLLHGHYLHALVVICLLHPLHHHHPHNTNAPRHHISHHISHNLVTAIVGCTTLLFSPIVAVHLVVCIIRESLLVCEFSPAYLLALRLATAPTCLRSALGSMLIRSSYSLDSIKTFRASLVEQQVVTRFARQSQCVS